MTPAEARRLLADIERQINVYNQELDKMCEARDAGRGAPGDLARSEQILAEVYRLHALGLEAQKVVNAETRKHKPI